MSADLSRIVALVPVRSLSGAKTRLAEPLDPEERAALIVGLARQTIRAALGCRQVVAVEVVSRDRELLSAARLAGAGTVLQRSDGLNEALDEAVASLDPNATAVLVLPGDLPAITACAVDDVVEAASRATERAPERPLVVVVPDRRGSGTNTLLVSPPGAIPFLFGEGSRAAHEAAASAAGATYVEVGGPLAFDLDTPDDLLEADAIGLSHEAGR